jgi:predicted aspartyl protease
MVNGKGPFRFGVDTGASGYLVVKPEVADRIGLAVVGEAMAGDPSGRNPVPVHLYLADSVSFGDLTFKDVSASSISLGGPTMAQLDGIIGIAFFRDLLVTLDFGRGRLIAAAGALPPPDDRKVVAASVEPSGLFSLPLRIGDKRVMVHLDTGNGRQALFLPQADIAGLPVIGEPRQLGIARTVSQEIQIMGVGLSVPVTIGTTRLPITQVAYPSVTVGNLGSAGLQGMAVTLDAANGRARVVPSADADVTPKTHG